MTPRSLDEARQSYPLLNFYITAEIGGLVSRQLVEPDEPSTPPQIATWSAPTERECWEQAFPPTAAEPLSFDESFMPREGTAAHAALAVSQDDEPGGLFD